MLAVAGEEAHSVLIALLLAVVSDTERSEMAPWPRYSLSSLERQAPRLHYSGEEPERPVIRLAESFVGAVKPNWLVMTTSYY